MRGDHQEILIKNSLINSTPKVTVVVWDFDGPINDLKNVPGGIEIHGKTTDPATYYFHVEGKMGVFVSNPVELKLTLEILHRNQVRMFIGSQRILMDEETREKSMMFDALTDLFGADRPYLTEKSARNIATNALSTIKSALDTNLSKVSILNAIREIVENNISNNCILLVDDSISYQKSTLDAEYRFIHAPTKKSPLYQSCEYLYQTLEACLSPEQIMATVKQLKQEDNLTVGRKKITNEEIEKFHIKISDYFWDKQKINYDDLEKNVSHVCDKKVEKFEEDFETSPCFSQHASQLQSDHYKIEFLKLFNKINFTYDGFEKYAQNLYKIGKIDINEYCQIINLTNYPYGCLQKSQPNAALDPGKLITTIAGLNVWKNQGCDCLFWTKIPAGISQMKNAEGNLSKIAKIAKERQCSSKGMFYSMMGIRSEMTEDFYSLINAISDESVNKNVAKTDNHNVKISAIMAFCEKHSIRFDDVLDNLLTRSVITKTQLSSQNLK